MNELQIHQAQCFNLVLTLLAFGFMQHVTKLAMRRGDHNSLKAASKSI
jgi:hypothetical protein